MNHDHIRFEALDLLVARAVVGGRHHRQTLFDEDIFPVLVVRCTTTNDEYEGLFSPHISPGDVAATGDEEPASIFSGTQPPT
jgi:hypothetical protein